MRGYKMDDRQKEQLTVNMVSNLPVLRKALGVSQEGLANMIGLNRSTVAAIENRKRKLPWDTSSGTSACIHFKQGN